MDMSEKYGVKKATSLSDDSVLYGDTSKGATWAIVIGTLLLTAALFVGVVYAHNTF